MTNLTRRKFNKALLGGVVATPISFMAVRGSHAEGLPLVDPESATAKALQYVAKAEDNTPNCAGCLLYADDGTTEKGTCTIFPGTLVPAEAWCAAYQPKPQ